MKRLVFCAILVIGAGAFAAPAFAGPVGLQHLNSSQQAAVVNDLQIRKFQLAEDADLENARGPLRIAYMERQGKIDNLVNRLQDGQPVSVHALNETMQPVTGESAE